MIISEAGAGAIPRYNDVRYRAKWSEEGQVDRTKELLEILIPDEQLTGYFIWQFCDCRVDPSWALSAHAVIIIKAWLTNSVTPNQLRDLCTNCTRLVQARYPILQTPLAWCHASELLKGAVKMFQGWKAAIQGDL